MTSHRDGYGFPHFVYRVYSQGGECLYVGLTRNLEQRIAHHRAKASWGLDMGVIEASQHPGFWAGREVEDAEITALRPRWNINGRGTRDGWTQCDYAEVLMAHRANHMDPDFRDFGPDHRGSLVRRMNIIAADFHRRFPDTAEHVLPSLGLAVAA